MRCIACDSEIDFDVDDELCPGCYRSYLESLEDDDEEK